MLSLLSYLIPLLLLGGIVGVIVVGLRAASGNLRGDATAVPFDGAETAKSAAIHVGLFLAMFACAIGVIDLLQSLVEGERIAGSNPDVARGLSLLIVGGPVFAFLVRSIDRRYAQRSARGDTQPLRGWSIYLVVALTVTLVATLASVAQVTESVTSKSGEFRPEQLMQLVGWLTFWLGHWFVLRPRFKVRGDAHLAIGSIIGLGWVITGAGVVVTRILDDAYQSTFKESLADSYDLTFWTVFAVVGVVVWSWHWHGHLNNAGSVEGDRRRSPLWFFTVVVAGVLPGLIAMLVTATTMISGVLIWFVGSTDEDAADFFEPVSALTTTLLLALMTWAYHRWELGRDGAPERNEPLRFHDYSVLATGLIGVVSATAVIVSQLVRVIAGEQQLAGELDITNTLIVAITILVASAAVWWWQWSHVEHHRVTGAVEECGSIWRKLYLITAFGVGGLLLSISTIWILFIVLRDLLDTQASHDTLQDLASPVGWAIAVLGAVWYHLGVWRVDRAVLVAESVTTDVPAEDHPLTIRVALAADYGELFTLQRAAVAEAAFRSSTQTITEPQESFDAMSTRLANSSTVLVVDGIRIIGSISKQGSASAEHQIAVVPDQPYDKIASLLLANQSSVPER